MREEQRILCERFESAFIECRDGEIVGVALNTLNQAPLYGIRIMPTHGTTGWYIWGGSYSESPDFYQPVHLAHLYSLCPIVIRYLALEPGFRFVVDSAGYEDVWREAS